MKLRTIAWLIAWAALVVVVAGVHTAAGLANRYTCAPIAGQDVRLSAGGWGNAAECVTSRGSEFPAERHSPDPFRPLWSFLLLVSSVVIPGLVILMRGPVSRRHDHESGRR
jgi:hypothetical protein